MNTQIEGRSPYFPPLYGEVDCRSCELNGPCHSSGCYQRDRRDFTVTSRRCPRLPDWRGFVADEQQDLYATLFPLIHADRNGEALNLEIQIPGVKRQRKVYRTKSGYWYFRDRYEGASVKHVITISEVSGTDDILRRMDMTRSDCCLFRCVIEDYFV